MRNVLKTWTLFSQGPFLLLAAVLVLLSAGSASAKNVAVYGFVLVPASATNPGAVGITPIEGVTIQIEGTGLSDTSDARGAFLFKQVPEGEITIVAFKPGFAPYTKKLTVKWPDAGRIAIQLVPGGGMTDGNREPIKPDTVYVAFATPPTSTPGHGAPSAPLSGAPTTTLGHLGALGQGVDPTTMGTGVPTMPTGPNQYQTSITASANSLMVLDPDQPQKVAYVESPARVFWLAFNEAGTKLFASTDQRTINIYDTIHQNTLMQQIPTGGVVNDMVRVKNLIYVAIMRTNGDAIMIIDPSRNAPISLIPTPGLATGGGMAHAWSVTASSDGSRLYVAIGSERDGEVVAIDRFTTHPVGRVRVGANPKGIAITPDNRYLLVANSKASTVTVLDAFTLQPVGQVPVGINPYHFAVRPDGTKAYVTCRSANAVHVINLSNMSPGAIIPVGSNPLGIAVSSDGAHVYVANQGSATVSVIDGNSDTFLKTTSPQPRSRPYGVAVKP